MREPDVLESGHGVRLDVATLALLTPAVGALVVGRGAVHAAIAVVVAAVLLVGFGAAASAVSGTVGIALSVAIHHGAKSAVIAIAVAGVLCAGFALCGVERVLGSLPRRSRAVVQGGLAVAAVALAARGVGATLAGRTLFPAEHVAAATPVIGDTVALALLLSLQAAALPRPRLSSARGHLAAASLLLPITFRPAARGGAVPALIVAPALLCALALLAPTHGVLLGLLGLSIAAARELATDLPGLRLRDLAAVLAVAVAAVAYRPAIALLFAIAAAIVLAPRATARSHTETR